MLLVRISIKKETLAAVVHFLLLDELAGFTLEQILLLNKLGFKCFSTQSQLNIEYRDLQREKLQGLENESTVLKKIVLWGKGFNKLNVIDGCLRKTVVNGGFYKAGNEQEGFCCKKFSLFRASPVLIPKSKSNCLMAFVLFVKF